jgi:AraC-like DNA-binding protein
MQNDWEELLKARAEYQSEAMPYDKYTGIVNKMRGFLAIAGEKKSKDTNELYREHIPQNVFGISSDEIASDLGISENELMEKITDGLQTKSRVYQPVRVTIAKIILSEVERKIAREKKRIAKIKAKFGWVFYGEMLNDAPLEVIYHL